MNQDVEIGMNQDDALPIVGIFAGTVTGILVSLCYI